VRKIAELSRQVRSLLNLKTNTIQYRFRSNSNISVKLQEKTFHENKRQFESLALRLIRLINKINGISRRTLVEEIQNLFDQVRQNMNSNSLLKELSDLTSQLFMKIHYFSEQDISDHPIFLKSLIQIAIEACKIRKSMNYAFSEFYDELGENYYNLEKEFTSIVPKKSVTKEDRKMKQLSEELVL